MLDDDFVARAAELYVPEMGTESIAPMLYWLIRTLRPRRALEVGMGFTTAYLARALADNVAADQSERRRLGGDGFADTNPMAHKPYYDDPYDPHLLCIDRMADTSSSAPRAFRVLQELELDSYCSVIEGDLRGNAPAVAERFGTVDFAWIDTWDTLAFVREYWPIIDAAGGVLAVHYLMTYPEGRAVQHYLRSLAGPDNGRLEINNVVEPHKFGQNSLTLVRRIRDYTEPEDLRPQGNSNDPVGILAADAVGAPRA
jgi:predicted O-methyltransferase YrrM